MNEIIYQFSFKRGTTVIPSGVPIVDCRAMGRAMSVEFARRLPAFEATVQSAINLLRAGGSVAVGCEWGMHRSVAVAEEVSRRTGAVIRRV